MISNALSAGLHGLVNGLSKEVASDQITVNALMPGYHLTERLLDLKLDEAALAASIPSGRIGSPADFAAVAAFLASRVQADGAVAFLFTSYSSRSESSQRNGTASS